MAMMARLSGSKGWFSMTVETDVALVQAALDGESGAFDRLVRMFLPIVYGKALLLTRNRHDAEDLAQETFARAHQKLKTLKSSAAFVPWLLTICANTGISKLRRAKHETTVDAPLEEMTEDYREDADPAVLQALEPDELKTRLFDALETLPEHYRLPILLHYMEGLSYRDIQERLQISSGAIKGIISRGLGRLRHALHRSGTAV